MSKKATIAPGDRVRVVQLRHDAAAAPRVPEDVLGHNGVVQWVTPGFAGEKTVFEVKLDDGRVVNFYAPEIEPVD